MSTEKDFYITLAKTASVKISASSEAEAKVIAEEMLGDGSFEGFVEDTDWVITRLEASE